MFLKQIGNNVGAFRDTIDVNLDFDLYYEYQTVSNIVDLIFALAEVIEADPTTSSNWYPIREQWICIHLKTIHLQNEQEVDDFCDTLKCMDGVRFVHPKYHLPATEAEIKTHLYGGVRAKEYQMPLVELPFICNPCNNLEDVIEKYPNPPNNWSCILTETGRQNKEVWAAFSKNGKWVQRLTTGVFDQKTTQESINDRLCKIEKQLEDIIQNNE